MLKGAAGFTAQTNDNKIFSGPYAACKSTDGKRWIITAWEPLPPRLGQPEVSMPALRSEVSRLPPRRDAAPERLAVVLPRRRHPGRAAPAGRDRLAAGQDVRFAARSSMPARASRSPHASTSKARTASWHFPRSESPQGTAIPYRKQRQRRQRRDAHHAVGPSVRARAAAGQVHRHGRARQGVSTRWSEPSPSARQPVREQFKLQRWIDMAERGWYSGDTHVHRTLEELPNVMLAEDLNVAFPLTYWVTEAFAAPGGGTGREPRSVDRGRPHPRHLSAQHRVRDLHGRQEAAHAGRVLRAQPPDGLRPGRAAGRCRSPSGPARKAALLELDKHNWPWSMALVPVMKVDLYELPTTTSGGRSSASPTSASRPPST